MILDSKLLFWKLDTSVEELLSKGLKFAILPANHNGTQKNVVADLSMATGMCDAAHQECVDILQNNLVTETDSKTYDSIRKLKTKLATNNLIATRADKGNIVVVVFRQEKKTEFWLGIPWMPLIAFTVRTVRRDRIKTRCHSARSQRFF